MSCRRCRRLFPVIGKILELLPNEALHESSEENKRMSAYQAGFSNRPDRTWKQPLRLLLHRMGNGYLYSWAQSSLERIFGGRSLAVLDAGCGDGILRRYLPRRHDYIGVDFSIRPLLRAQAYNPGTYYRADVNQLPFPDCAFDAVLSFQALQYLARPKAALAQMARVLKPGGKLLLTVPNDESFKYRWQGVPEIQLQRFDRQSLPVLLAGHFEDLHMQPRGLWVPVPMVSLHAPGAYSERWGLSWTVIATPRK